MAPNGVVQVMNYNTRSPAGDVHLLGGIISKGTEHLELLLQIEMVIPYQRLVMVEISGMIIECVLGMHLHISLLLIELFRKVILKPRDG